MIAGLRDRLPLTRSSVTAPELLDLVHRYTLYRRYGTQFVPVSGSMGYGVPAAIAMKRLRRSAQSSLLPETATSS